VPSPKSIVAVPQAGARRSARTSTVVGAPTRTVDGSASAMMSGSSGFGNTAARSIGPWRADQTRPPGWNTRYLTAAPRTASCSIMKRGTCTRPVAAPTTELAPAVATSTVAAIPAHGAGRAALADQRVVADASGHPTSASVTTTQAIRSGSVNHSATSRLGIRSVDCQPLTVGPVRAVTNLMRCAS
jgi:hypothetical protein